MGKKVTIQDIADALGLSRNPVSKAINNSEGLAENTKQLILDKAVEMGYKQFSYVMAMAEVNRSRTVADEIPQSGEIALFTTSQKNRGSHFSSLMMDKFAVTPITISSETINLLSSITSLMCLKYNLMQSTS